MRGRVKNIRLLSAMISLWKESVCLRQFLLGWLTPILVMWLITCLLVDDVSRLDFDQIGGDATQNFYSAMNLSHYGIYSENLPSADVTPGFRREPIPNFILAGYLRLINCFMPSFVVDGFLDVPELLYAVKTINLGYSITIMLLMWLLCRFLFKPYFIADFMALPLIWSCHEYFIADEINGLNTELVVALVLLLLTYLLLKAYETPVCIWIASAGLGLGLLALTKAVGAYLALLVIPIAAAVIARRSIEFPRIVLALSIGFLLTISPWVLRNQIVFGKVAIAKGGGDVLLIRSVFNTMLPLEYQGAFFAFSPEGVQGLMASSLLPFQAEDLECGGPLERLNRGLPCDQLAFKEQRFDDVRSFYRRGKHALPILLGLSPQQRQAEAIRRITAEPWSHVAASLPMAWRGFWAFTDRGWLSIVVNASAFVALLMAPWIGILRKRLIWIMVGLVPFTYFLFYASLTHFLPRYAEPLIPVSLIALGMVFVDLIFSKLFSNLCYLRR